MKVINCVNLWLTWWITFFPLGTSRQWCWKVWWHLYQRKIRMQLFPQIIGELRSCPLLGKCWKRYSRDVRKLSYLRTSPGCSPASRRSPHLSTQPSWFRKCRMRRKIVVNRLHLWRWMRLTWYGRDHYWGKFTWKVWMDVSGLLY